MELAYHTRAIRWTPFAIAAVVSTVTVVALRKGSAAKPIEVISILIASAAGFALDDSAANVLDAVPVSLLKRRLTRVLYVLGPACCLWAPLVWLQGPASAAEGWALVAMFAGLLGLAFGFAGVATRRMAPGRGGIAVAPALLCALIVSTTLPPRWRPLPLGDIPGGWAAIDLRWSTAAMVGSVMFLWSSRDRAGRPAIVGKEGAS